MFFSGDAIKTCIDDPISGACAFEAGISVPTSFNFLKLGKYADDAFGAANGADDVVNGTRLGQQFARESAYSIFTSSGRLSSGASPTLDRSFRRAGWAKKT